jgi:hypothetical protein
MGHHLRKPALLFVAVLLAACSGPDPTSTASEMTRAVYVDDVGGVVSHVDESLVTQISRASVGVLSDKMHALGQYDSLTLRNSRKAR